MLRMVVSRFYSHYVIIAHLAHELTSIRRCCLAIVFPQLLIRVMENTSSYSSVLHMVKSYHDCTQIPRRGFLFIGLIVGIPVCS